MKISEAPSGVKAKKKKKNAAQQQMEVSGEDLGAAAGQLPSDRPHVHSTTLQ